MALIKLASRRRRVIRNDIMWNDEPVAVIARVVFSGSSQRQAPHEEAPQPPTDQDRVRRGDGARAVPGARADVGRRLAGGAAHHHVLH